MDENPRNELAGIEREIDEMLSLPSLTEEQKARSRELSLDAMDLIFGKYGIKVDRPLTLRDIDESHAAGRRATCHFIPISAENPTEGYRCRDLPAEEHLGKKAKEELPWVVHMCCPGCGDPGPLRFVQFEDGSAEVICRSTMEKLQWCQ